MTKPIVVNLDRLVTVAGRIMLGNAEHDVRPLDGAGYHVLSQLRAAQDVDPATVDVKEQLEYLQTAYALVRRLVPSLPSEVVDTLNDKQVAAILQIATGQIEAVTKQIEAARGNEHPPAKKGRTRA